MANIKDIAKHLGVSVSTVSRAMNNHPDVREETKQQVMEAIRLYNYRPNALAKGLIQKKTFTIGLLVPDISDPFPSSLSNAVEETLFEHGYQVVFGNGNRNSDKEKQFLLNAVERQFDGLILTPDYMDEEFSELLSNLEIPIVFLRRRPPAGLSFPFVDVDHYQAAKTAMQYLLELGHRQIGFIGMPQSSFIGNERLRGYTDVMRLHGIDPGPGHMILGGRTIDNGREAMGRLLDHNPDLTAVFAANDLLGIGALEWLAMHQIAVPDKLSVMGFDNLEYAGLYWIQLTTMEQPRREMGVRAAQMLLQMIANKEQTPESDLMEAKLVIRKTCKARLTH
ncbi:LacI family DNA-binding transcriptional regulator [Paenibacillus ehimensis]|uniref:LacI family DNA-binding transcriptional regulator n=1 Tax=Paenibacillus ehimensis TaxID=79264 RepID=UPI002DBF5F38|nr:LacI family DNA-binding transcriptional regulator [Paenibacillus ehimensis]MEC0210403.1 LacI family DNA-binding transcriptional regulator [Paenibacillus ehimensis]